MQSPVWNYFTRLAPNVATCDLCDLKLKYKTSVSNLGRHLLRKHKVNLKSRVTKSGCQLDAQINVRQLINLVKDHTCLWDESSNSSGDQEMRAKAWNMIATCICPEMDPVIAAGKLSKRFCLLKENFLKEKLPTENSSSFEDSVYYDDLQFLNSSRNSVSNLCSAQNPEDAGQQVLHKFEITEVIIKDEHVNELCDENEYNEEGTSSEERSFRENTDANSPRQENAQAMTNVKDILTTQTIKAERVRDIKKTGPCEIEINNANKNVLFLLSMTEEMRRVPADAKTRLKSEFMTVMARLVQKYRYISYENGGN